MAVQAQYPPSNALLLNRNMQEANDFSLQPQPGGIFLDQSSSPHILFTSGAGINNQRKRAREMPSATVNFNGNNNNPMVPFNATSNSIQLQSQAPQRIDLTQLYNRQPSNVVVSTGLRLSFGEHQPQQRLQLQQQGLVCNATPSSFVRCLTDDVAAEIKQQREEIDQFLHAQGEYLRRTLAEKRQGHYRALLGAAESSVARRLREKDAEIEKAARRQAELEARAVQLAVESQQWQAKARASEAVAASLQVQLQQAWCDRGVGDEEAAAVDGLAGEAEDAESAYVDPERVEMVGPSCRGCNRRVATVVVLPCRHLCACPECDRLVQACPLCFCHKSSSVEVYFS